ncbi:MAG: XRE family transcriptional regulator [Oscillospiraceae bacterium]|nr:XRE family transcriptional regulator [Oscillospiraceae bacterium]
METKIMEIAQRIRELRMILEMSEQEMADITDVSLEEYREYEAGKKDYSFTFLYECARAFGVDIVELLTGENPKLSFYTVVRAGKGLPIRRRQSFTYQHLAYRLKDKLAEPFVVTAPYNEHEQNTPIHLSHHEGQEFDFILKGSLKVQIDDHIEVLGEGDAIYYDSGHGHGMIATGGAECVFLAVVIGEQNTGA